MVCASGDAEAHRQLYVAAPRKVRRGWIKVHRGVAARSTQRTGAQRMSYTLAAAAAACGLNKSMVLRAIKAGKIAQTVAPVHRGGGSETRTPRTTAGLGRIALKRCHAQAVRAAMLLRLRQEPPTVAERSLRDRAERFTTRRRAIRHQVSAGF